MEILSKLFGSEARVKILRLFLFNPDSVYTGEEVISRTKITTKEFKTEISSLLYIGLLKRKPFTRDIEIKKGKKIIQKKIKGNGFVLDQKFRYLNALKNLLITVSLHSREEISSRFNKVGKLKLLVTSGVFIQDWESRLDIMIVGDELNKTKIERIIKDLESEIGKELSYSIMDTSEFEYRIGVYDKLVRDVLDFPHDTIVDRLGVENKAS